jgi:hypothetical protein
MKRKLILCSIPWLLFIGLLLPYVGHSQSKGGARQITISASGVSYDDAGFTALREKIKIDKSISDLKESYSNDTGTITFLCSLSATDLWDEMPSSVKQSFKVSAIDDQHIILTGKIVAAAANNTSGGNTTISANSDIDCKTCYGYICKYDVIKTFQGVKYVGINYDQGTYYYNCDNGVLIRKIIITNGYGATTGIQTDTLIMSNVPAGTTWGVATGFENTSWTGFTLIAKNLSVDVDNKQYNDVIIVNYRKYASIFGMKNGVSINRYYARGIGLIKSDTLDYTKDPMQLYKNEMQATATAQSLKGIIDPGMVGIWKSTDGGDLSPFYKFNSDGTFNYYVGSVDAADEMYKGGKNFWKLDGDKLNEYFGGMNKIIQFTLEKITDAASGRPAIKIGFSGGGDRIFVATSK